MGWATVFEFCPLVFPSTLEKPAGYAQRRGAGLDQASKSSLLQETLNPTIPRYSMFPLPLRRPLSLATAQLRSAHLPAVGWLPGAEARCAAFNSAQSVISLTFGPTISTVWFIDRCRVRRFDGYHS